MPVNSIVTKLGDGSTTDFTFSFTGGYMDEDHVFVRVGAENDGSGNPVYRPITFLSEGTVRVGGDVVASGVEIKIFRQTPIQVAVNDYSDGTVLNEQALDDSFKQLVFAAQELNDALTSARRAETAQAGAEDARDTAVTAANLAESARVSATASAASATDSAQDAADQLAVVQAAGAAEIAAVSAAGATQVSLATTQAGLAEAARDAAGAHSVAAAAARVAAEVARDAAIAAGIDPNAVDFNGGTMDGVVIGGNSAVDGTFRSIRTTGNSGTPLIVQSDGGQINYLESINNDHVQLRFRTDDENRRIISENDAGQMQTQIIMYNNRLFFNGQDGSRSGNKFGEMTRDGYFPITTPQFWGALGDGVTDDTAAFQDWFDYIVDNSAEGFVPGGDYVINGAGMQKTVTSRKAFTVSGAGKGVTRFLIGGDGHCFRVHCTGPRDGQATYRDFTIMTDVDNAATGLQHTYIPGGSQHQRNVIVTNVEVRGNNLVSNRFTTPFNLTGCHRPIMENCIYNGPYHLLGLENSSLRYATPVACILDSCYDPVLRYCHFWGAYTAVRSHGPNEEAFRMENCVLNQCRVGLDYHRTDGREPMMWLHDNHCNYRDVGFLISGCKLLHVSGNLIYNEDSTSVYTQTPYDIRLVDCSQYMIVNNQFHFDGHPSRVAIFVNGTQVTTTGNGGDGIISGNQFTFPGHTYVWLANGVLNVRGENMFLGTVSNENVRNGNGANNNVRAMI